MAAFFFVIAIGLIVFVLAVLILEDWEFLRQARHRVRGTVFDHRRDTSDGSEYFSAMVRFKTHDGQTVEFTDTLGRPAPRPAVGTELEVVYPAEMPGKARVRRPSMRIAMYSGLGLTFIILILASVGLLT